MSLRDLNMLKDKHLQKALQHAPDNDVTPSEITSKTVLDYASKALIGQRETWFSRLKSMFNDFKIARWQLTGMGSLAPSLLVVVMIWHENPDDPMQVATAPNILQTETEPRAEHDTKSNAKPKTAQNELVRDGLVKDQAAQKPQAVTEAAPVANEPIAASAETIAPEPEAEDKNETKVFAKNNPVRAEASPQAAVIEAPMDQASVQLKERAASIEAVPTPAPVAAAPAPTLARVEGGKNAVAQQSAPTKKAVEQMAEVGAKSDNADSEMSSVAAKPTLARNIALVQAINKEGGKAMANQDIQAGNLRILYLSSSAPADPPLLDDVTGYRVEFIVDDSAILTAEIAIYNQTMRDWYIKQNQ